MTTLGFDEHPRLSATSQSLKICAGVLEVGHCRVLVGKGSDIASITPFLAYDVTWDVTAIFAPFKQTLY